MDTESMLRAVNNAISRTHGPTVLDLLAVSNVPGILEPVAAELLLRLDAERRVSRIGEQIRLQSLGADARWVSLADQVDQLQAWPPRWVVGAEVVDAASSPWLEELPQTD